MAHFVIKKGLDIQMQGAPSQDVEVLEKPAFFSVYPSDFEGVKPRLKVQEGDTVKRGDVLFENKKHEAMLFRAPCSGTIKSIVLGARRAPQEIVIARADNEEEVSFDTIDPATVERQVLIDHLFNTGLWPLIKQRPFSKIADPATPPKAIFVNAMHTAPFQVDPQVALKGKEGDFLAGLSALKKLTEGKIHVCASKSFSVDGVKSLHTFEGPHPTGNTSVHINRISPILPHDTVYTLRAQDVVKIGQLLTTGRLPLTQIISLGGAGIKPEYAKHYEVHIGGSLDELLEKALIDKEVRILSGNILSGKIVPRKTSTHFYDQEINVIEEDRQRVPFGWTLPGIQQYSAQRTNLSSWLPKRKRWNLGTNIHGSHRALVVTGWMDKYMPLNIMTDYLFRAILAHDTDEAIQLGILETDPEDFALCSFIDPAKHDFCTIVKQGLEEIEKEGI